ncbi:MAG: YkgJ family cysteine cluster protein [Leptolyngbyaceae cyanobacterium SM1_1_3]|nr:YkgJ family cysteine cluster protein [Leptolyngbyaceae cyanobacterium SM1_1_3]NJO09167.1 YkgJ family cysteine cluster protein [Leptolyngbyaceae cyanobacterium SL_1_1]
MATWQCVKNCGACCHLAPEERPDLEDYLAPAELDQYLSLVGKDGWCIHYDANQRECRIYSDRPRFCRVEASTFEQMYGIEPADLNEFAIDCCQQQIGGVYGESSLEMERFSQAIAS